MCGAGHNLRLILAALRLLCVRFAPIDAGSLPKPLGNNVGVVLVTCHPLASGEPVLVERGVGFHEGRSQLWRREPIERPEVDILA